jgi:putative intracellular protease/amidase
MPQEMKVAALLADAFQEEEFFFPKVALNKAGYTVETVSIGKGPVEIYSFFRRTGLLDVDRTIEEISPAEYLGYPAARKAPLFLPTMPGCGRSSVRSTGAAPWSRASAEAPCCR